MKTDQERAKLNCWQIAEQQQFIKHWQISSTNTLYTVAKPSHTRPWWQHKMRLNHPNVHTQIIQPKQQMQRHCENIKTPSLNYWKHTKTPNEPFMKKTFYFPPKDVTQHSETCFWTQHLLISMRKMPHGFIHIPYNKSKVKEEITNIYIYLCLHHVIEQQIDVQYTHAVVQQERYCRYK